MQANVTAHSQTFRLRERMDEARIRHGQTVSADIPNVRVLAEASGSGLIFFCNMEPIKVNQVLQEGDQEALPERVVLEGLDFPESGTYDITNALVSANGAIRISASAQTRIRSRNGIVSRLFGNFAGL